MRIIILLAVLSAVSISACSSGPKIKQQKFARLQNSKDFENEYAVVWKAIVAATEDYKIVDKNEESGQLTTDWVYTTSNEKYYEYTVNGLPRKHYLQTRSKFQIIAQRKLGSVNVSVSPVEQVEKVKSDGTFDDWIDADRIDSARANEIPSKMELAIRKN